MDEFFMNIALKEAKKAFKKKEIPVGCVIVYKNKIIAKAYNRREKTKLITSHAELIAIQKAEKKLKSWRLNECILYTTLEPCNMCEEAIIQSRIKNVVFATKNSKKTKNCIKNISKIKSLNIENQSKNLIQKFFQDKRNNNML